MCTTVTREVVASPDVQFLECLSVGMNVAHLWPSFSPALAQRIPEYIRLRILRQFAVTVAQAIDVIALLGGRNLQVYRIERKRS